MPGNTELAYNLPPAIKGLQRGWLSSCQSIAIVSALFTAVAAQLLVYFTDPATFSEDRKLPSQTHLNILVALSYCGLIFSAGATTSAMLLAIKLSELPVRATWKSSLPLDHSVYGTTTELLRYYGVGRSWVLVKYHCICCLALGIYSVIAQVMVFVFLQEVQNVFWSMIIVVGVAIIMPLVLMIFV